MNEFFDLNMINPALKEALLKQNIVALTEIQKKAIPEALKNKDIVVQSETGTGKTLAYLVPLFQKTEIQKHETQAIILTPTHELAIQVLRQIELLSLNAGMMISSTPIIGNVNIDRQIDKLKAKPHIIVGSAGRILELIKKKKIAAHTVKTIVIDEADTLIDKNNLETVREVIKCTQKDRQLMMFSATITNEAKERAIELMKQPEFISDTKKATVPDSIEHMYFMAESREKIEVLRKIIRIMKPSKALLFVSEREQLDILTERLLYHGIKVKSLHGDKQKNDRKTAMNEFRSGKIQVLAVTDIAARGLDIEGVTHIINMDIPEKVKIYLHRAGRTGRMGKKGIAVSIVSKQEEPIIFDYEKSLNITISPKNTFKDAIIDLKK
ncbi:MAG: DEAD/DEAH box helicase [Clostridia bacterium]|nr:DEAD/DEAH box helicase [Clostridia bacterium]